MFLYVVAWGWSEGITAVQGFGMGDLTEVGKSLIAFLHYWWVFYIPFGNQSEPFFFELQRAQGKNAAGCLSTIYHGKGRFSSNRKPNGFWVGCVAGLDGCHKPCPAEQYGCHSFTTADSQWKQEHSHYIGAPLRAADRCDSTWTISCPDRSAGCLRLAN